MKLLPQRMTSKIPTDYIEFLYWIKDRTETYWSKTPSTAIDAINCEEWLQGAKWIGLDESEIDSIEKEFNVKFTFHHREFLKILHTIDRVEIVEYTKSFDEDAEVFTKEVPYFYNWKTDKEEIIRRLKWPYETIFQDVVGTNKVWLESWGKTRPKSDTEKEKIFSEWFEKTPKLIPISSHRFVVSDDLDADNPVLSVYGSDTIVYGWSMRDYLLNEIGGDLDIFKLVYDKEDEEWYSEVKPEYETDMQNANSYYAENKVIPYFEEMILYWSSGWCSYGKKYPYKTEGGIQPITKTFIPEDESDEETQKRFNPF